MVDEHEETPAATDMGEHLRTWRLFISMVKWNLIAAGVLMLFLLMFRTHG
jgi:hypothetical protein